MDTAEAANAGTDEKGPSIFPSLSMTAQKARKEKAAENRLVTPITTHLSINDIFFMQGLFLMAIIARFGSKKAPPVIQSNLASKTGPERSFYCKV